ncbi:MAG: UDP-glucuronic acid decarboxylase family protein [Candidatus Paceibacterota bacterium]|jgi:UDP-glucuronate decarboxylase
MGKIVVTGGAGFVGSHLVDALLLEGNEVIVIDNMSTGTRENLKHEESNPNLQVIEHDITLPLDLSGIDAIYNLACPASPPHYQADPLQTLKTNFQGVLNMLELAKKNGASFLQASTSEIYGDPLEHPQRESYWGNVNTLGPRSCYDEGKRVAETLVYEYKKLGLDAKIVRIFNTYGPRMNFEDGRVVSNFVLQALRNEPLTVYGKGDQTRSFCYVSDLVSGIKKTMEKENFFGPVNLGNPLELTVEEIGRKIIAMTGSSSELVYKPLPQDDPIRRKPDILLAQTELQWEPKVSLGEGLGKIIDDFKSRLAK